MTVTITMVTKECITMINRISSRGDAAASNVYIYIYIYTYTTCIYGTVRISYVYICIYI